MAISPQPSAFSNSVAKLIELTADSLKLKK